jgi:D-alanyl-lipoteichoic acid acyltransferase DltB (MBOAT superfamily)
MAMGISKMLNLELPVNFNSPYKAKTILEFWDRWHITLTRFLRKYLYIPLGGNQKGRGRTYLNIMIVFLCSGLWHGAGLNFIVWGMAHGCFVIVAKHFQRGFERLHPLVNWLITIAFVNATWILFRAESLRVAARMLKALMKNDWGALNNNIAESWLLAVAGVLVLGIMLFRGENVQEMTAKLRYNMVSCLLTILVLVASVLSLSGVSTFVYFGF